MKDTIGTFVKRFKELSNYNTINEGYGDVDTTGWTCVGEVAYDPWLKGIDKLYVMVNPQKTMKFGKEVNDVRYTENPDGSGGQIDNIPTRFKEEITIYPEHQDDELGEIFLGKRQNDKTAEGKHKEFLSKLFRIGDDVIIHHNSSYPIKDGFVKKGRTNGWSNNTDVGIYFWGGKDCGKDPSNASTYTYYCIIEQDNLYDFETNAERLSLRQALRKHPYAGQYWTDGQSIVVNTLKDTPIWRILDKSNGKWYDKDWNEVKKPFLHPNINK